MTFLTKATRHKYTFLKHISPRQRANTHHSSEFDYGNQAAEFLLRSYR